MFNVLVLWIYSFNKHFLSPFYGTGNSMDTRYSSGYGSGHHEGVSYWVELGNRHSKKSTICNYSVRKYCEVSVLYAGLDN